MRFLSRGPDRPSTESGGAKRGRGRPQVPARSVFPLLGLLASPALLLVLFVPSPVSAAEQSVSDVVLVEAGSVIPEDLYAAGNRVVVEGRIDGDLLVAAYEDVTISGTVAGDVLAVAGTVVITGSVGESVRVVTPSLDVSGTVGGDVFALSWDNLLAAQVGGEATLWSWAAQVGGSVAGDLTGQMRRLTLAGRIDGDVDVTVTRLLVEEGTVIGRDLGYRSGNEGVNLAAAEVGGIVVHRRPLPPNIRIRALMVLAKVVAGLLATGCGLVVMWALPGAAQDALARVRASWWRSWLRGLGVMALPLAAVALAGTLVGLAPAQAAVPLLAVLVPVFLAVLGLVLALGLVASAAVYPWIGRFRGEERGPVRAFLYGAAAVIVAALVPWLVWVVVLVVVPIGIGGWLGSRPVAPIPDSDQSPEAATA